MQEETSRAPSLTQQVSRAVAWNALLGPLKMVAELISTLIKFNILSPSEAGLIRLVSSAASSLGTWTDLGIDRSLPRFIPEVDQEGGRASVRRFMNQIFAIKGLLIVGFLIFIAFFGGQADKLNLGTEAERAALGLEGNLLWLAIVTVSVIVVLGSIYDGLMAYLISFFHQKAWNLIALVSGLALPIVSAVLIIMGFRVYGVLLAMILAQVVGVGLALWQVRRAMQQASEPVSKKQEKPELEQEKRPFWGRFVLYTAMSHLLNISDWVVRPDFAVLLLPTLADKARMTVAFSLVGTVLNLLYMPLAGLQVPLFTRVRGDQHGLRTAYAGLGRLLVLMIVPGGIGLALLAAPAVFIQYPLYLDVVPAIQILIPILFIESILSLGHNVLIVHERYREVTISRLYALVAAPLLIWLVPTYGLMGAVAALGLGRAASGISATWYAWRYYDLSFSWDFTGRVLLASGVMAGVVWGLIQSPLLPQISSDASWQNRLIAVIPLLVIAGVGGLVFLLVLRMLGGLLPEDRQRLAQSRLPFKRILMRLI